MFELNPVYSVEMRKLGAVRSCKMDELWPERRWIPIKETLPEKHQMVLMCYGTDATARMRVGCITAIHYGQAVWSSNEVNSIVMRVVCDPDFWMPLPTPPESEEEND